MRELERAVDAVVVGERERVVAELGRPRGELFGERRAVEERVRGVRVQLDVRRNSRTRFALTADERRRLALRLLLEPNQVLFAWVGLVVEAAARRVGVAGAEEREAVVTHAG